MLVRRPLLQNSTFSGIRLDRIRLFTRLRVMKSLTLIYDRDKLLIIFACELCVAVRYFCVAVS